MGINSHGSIKEERVYWDAASPADSLRHMAGSELGELLAGTAAAVADVCFVSGHATTHRGPADVHAVRCWERFEASARHRLREITRRDRNARGETLPIDADFAETHSHARQPLATGESLSDAEARAHGLGESDE